MNVFSQSSPQKFSQEFQQDVVMKCLEVRPDNSSVFELSLPNVAMKMNLGGIVVNVDTREPENVASTQPRSEFVRRLFSAMTRVRCKVTFSPTGEPLKIDGLSEGMDDVLKELGADLLPGLRQMFDQLREQLADNIIEENMRTVFRMTPDGAKARVGDKWTREWQVTLPPFNVASQGKAEYELVGTEMVRGRPCAKIRVKSTLTTLPRDKQDPAKIKKLPKGILDRMQFTMDMAGGDGTAYLDYTNGDIVQYRETQRSTLEISMEPDPSAQADDLRSGLAKITQRLTTSVQIDLLDEAEAASPAPSATAPAARR
jgi:hypothetical protein